MGPILLSLEDIEKRNSRHRRIVLLEVFVLALVSTAIYAKLVHFEAFEALYEFSRSHEHWEIDELVLLLPVLTVSLAVFTFNRLLQIRRDGQERAALKDAWLTAATTFRLTGLPAEQVTLARMAEVIVKDGKPRHALFVLRSDIRMQAGRIDGPGSVLPEMRAFVDWVKNALPSDAVLGSLDNDTMLVLAPLDGPDDEAELQCLLAKFARPYEGGRHSIQPVIRVGVSVLEPGDADASAAMWRAMQAMEGIGAAGARFTHAVYNSELEQDRSNRRTMLADVEAAFDEDAFEFAYQPIMDLRSGRIHSFEVLSRWKGRDGRDVAPDLFIPLIEEAGLMAPFTYRLLDKALALAAHWPDDIGVSVNLSRSHLLDPELMAQIQQRLAEYAFDPGRLDIEVTETHELLDPQTSGAVIHRLREQGIKVSIDDFGAGHSNLNLLHDIDFDCIKIDRKVITDVLTNPKDKAIVSAMAQMSASLSRTITAEGVEDQKTAELLRRLGVSKAQGYFYARPMPATEVAAFIAATEAGLGRSMKSA
jgi:EAL domain-containing protein (putative c-di-GMP-specific phosphodiesterase class I)/GGDEF domain-containing protein